MAAVREHTEQFRKALEALDKVQADRLFRQALSDASPLTAVETLVVPALDEIGKAWDDGRIALSQVYMSARICEDLVEKVMPRGDPVRRHQPGMAIAVLNDYHMLGKRIVHSVLRAGGFEIEDYGRQEVSGLVERVGRDGVRILLISVLMLPSALKARELRDALDRAGLDVKIAVGGAPFLFDAALWREVGADAMGRCASDAVDIVRGWVESM